MRSTCSFQQNDNCSLKRDKNSSRVPDTSLGFARLLKSSHVPIDVGLLEKPPSNNPRWVTRLENRAAIFNATVAPHECPNTDALEIFNVSSRAIASVARVCQS